MAKGDSFPRAPEGAAPAFDADHARTYSERARRQVPGFADLHRMTSLLLAEHVSADGRVLVLGAGGGLEIRALAEDHSGWRFCGVYPSVDMLRAARQTIGPHVDRVDLHEGDIHAAPDGPFDGAVCLLTLHFVPREQRLETLRGVHRRLAPGAPFVVAHISFPQTEPERTLNIARHIAFGGTDPAKAESARQAIATRLSVLSPDEDERFLREAGFSGVSLFYAGLSFRGWVGTA